VTALSVLLHVLLSRKPDKGFFKVSLYCRTASETARGKRSLAALEDNQVEDVEWKQILACLAENQLEDAEWKEILEVEEENGPALKLVDLKCVGVVGHQGSLAAQLVDCLNAKPSVVNVGVHIMSSGTACSRFNIMPVSGQPSLTVMKLIVRKTILLKNALFFTLSVFLLLKHCICILSLPSKCCSGDASYCSVLVGHQINC
jgi:hypothetical protein